MTSTPTRHPLRVSYVTTSYPRHEHDPDSHFIARIAEGVAALGASVRVYAPHASGTARSEVARGVAITRFRYAPEGFERVAYAPGVLNNVKRDPRAMLAFPGFLAALRGAMNDAARSADVVHVHWAQTAYAAGAGRASTPFALTIHGSDLELVRTYPRLERTLRVPLARADAVVTVSPDLATRLTPYMPAETLPRVIGGGVEAAIVESGPRSARQTDGIVRLLLVSRLLESKGVLDLAEALVRIGGGFHLTVIGVGPEHGTMLTRFADAGLADAVTFRGSVPHAQVIKAMREVDLVVMPSHREGCGLVPIEAAAVGVPAVVTDTGMMPEIAGCPEAITQPGDVDGLERALRAMIRDPELRLRCATVSNERVRAGFTWEHIARQHVELYQEMLASKRASGLR